MNRQFLFFLVTGGLAACVNFFSRILLSFWLSYTTAIVVAYLFGMSTAFLLNKLIVFRKADNALHHQLFWFCIVNIAAVLQTLAVSLLLADIVFPQIGFHWHVETTAHAIGVAFPVVTSFIGHKKLSFRNG
jgi:putative flippase GtrA